MSIMVVMLPLLGLAFYQLTVIPPNDTVQLSLNNEVGQLAAMLYQDGNMAENFTAGTGPADHYPYYYGNFSWTNYSTGDCYFVSYYYTCNTSSNASCNHIVRQVTVTHNCTTQSSSTSTTPTPTPTPTPPSEYTSCNSSDWGIRFWAWGRTWASTYLGSLSIQVTADPPDFSKFVSPAVFLTSTESGGGNSINYTLYEAQRDDFNATCSIDASGDCSGTGCSNSGNYWSYSDSYKGDLGWDTELFTFKIYQAPTNVSSLSITWRGHGDSSAGPGFYSAVCIWNSSSGMWYNPIYIPPPVITPTGCSYNCTFGNYSATITTNPANFVDATGNVSILALSRRDAAKTVGIYTDYIELDVH